MLPIKSQHETRVCDNYLDEHRVQDVVQVDVAENRRDHCPLRCPHLRLAPDSPIDDAAFEHALNQAQHSLVGDSLPQHPHQPALVDGIEVGLDIRVQDPAHLLRGDRHVHRVQGIMLTAPRPESIAEPQKQRLVDGFPYPHHRLLDDLVFQRGDADWALAAVGLGNPLAEDGLAPVAVGVQATAKVGQPLFQPFAVAGPIFAVHTHGRAAVEMPIRRPEQVRIDVMQQVVEPQEGIAFRGFA